MVASSIYKPLRYVALIATLAACKKNETGDPASTTGNKQLEEVKGTFAGTMVRHTTRTIDTVTTVWDTTMSINLQVTNNSRDSIYVSLDCCNKNRPFVYEGHASLNYNSFLSHPGGYHEYFIYYPATDSVLYIYYTYSTNYVRPLNASSQTDTFRGKRL